MGGGVTVASAKSAKPSLKAEWWTTSEVAAYVGVKVATISAYRSRGQMPEPDQKLGRTQLWRPKTIIQWHNSRPGSGNWQ